MNQFKDHFSHDSSKYAAARPAYPLALFEALAGLCSEKDLALDCATGSGQAALPLCKYFAKVVATDASNNQIEAARRALEQHERARPFLESGQLVLTRAPAESSGLDAASVDLITVAQALHWLDFQSFYQEAERVLKPGGLLAVWCYGLPKVTPAVDEVFSRLYYGIVGPYWPSERAHIEDAYSRIKFPFAQIELPEFSMELAYNCHEYLAYLETWSAVAAFRRKEGEDPIALIRNDMQDAWADTERKRAVRFPLTVRAGYCSAQSR